MSIKISQLGSAALPLSGGESVVMNQNGVTVTSTLNNVKTYVLSGVSFGSNVSSLSANWQNTYTTVASNSANYALKNTNNNFSATQTFATSEINLGSCRLKSSGIDSIYIGGYAGDGSGDPGNAMFIGPLAGYNATNSAYSTFIGPGAGSNTVNAGYSIFIGIDAGQTADNAESSFFCGNFCGNGAVSAINSNFLGGSSGVNANNASYSNFIGNLAGYGSSNAQYCNFIGKGSGYFVTGSRNQLIGANTLVSPVSLSGCIVLGDGAVATQSNTIAIGSTTTPLLTSGSGTSTGNYLVIRLNGQNLKIPLYS